MLWSPGLSKLSKSHCLKMAEKKCRNENEKNAVGQQKMDPQEELFLMSFTAPSPGTERLLGWGCAMGVAHSRLPWKTQETGRAKSGRGSHVEKQKHTQRASSECVLHRKAPWTLHPGKFWRPSEACRGGRTSILARKWLGNLWRVDWWCKMSLRSSSQTFWTRIALILFKQLKQLQTALVCMLLLTRFPKIRNQIWKMYKMLMHSCKKY